MQSIEQQTLTTYQNQMESNHAPITLFFGELKTGKAKVAGTVLYEVIYLERYEQSNGIDILIDAGIVVRHLNF